MRPAFLLVTFFHFLYSHRQCIVHILTVKSIWIIVDHCCCSHIHRKKFMTCKCIKCQGFININFIRFTNTVANFLDNCSIEINTMSANTSHTEKELDLSNAGRGVWLVKVPKYIANKWEKAPGNIEVGKLKITKNPGQKAEVSLKLSEAVLALKEPGEEEIPKQHRLDVTTVTKQMLGVFSHVTPSNNSDSIVPETEKLYMEGRIVQKLECRPYADNCYMKLKLQSIKRASVPQRQVQQLDRVVQNFKPVSDHKHNIEYAEKKKAEGKKMRDDKDAVLDMLFAAFEKHQYYNIRDLVKITRQPIVYLKEILNEVCNYNLKNPHRNMWELKPEYRHYKDEDRAAENAQKKDDSDDD